MLIYLVFLLIFGMPILMAEFAVGRAASRSVGRAFERLEPKGTKWHYAKWPMVAGNYLLMMFYTTVCGWMLYYFYRMVAGDFQNVTPAQVGAMFGETLVSPAIQVGWMVATTAIGFGIVSLGLQKGVERITKLMMSCLFVIMVALAIRAVTLPGADAGLRFYLLPDFSRLVRNGLGESLFAALGQSFFTLSLGIGAMTIFGSYIQKNHSIAKEATNICALDTAVALLAGLIIIPSCFAFGLEPNAGPGLIFVTLPNVFSQMPAGRFFGAAFFLFLSFAALSTVIAVFENITTYWRDARRFERKRIVVVNAVLVVLLSLPCALGFNLLSGFQPFGEGSCVLDLEDFLVSNTLLPLGSLLFIVFCTQKRGWGEERFYTEVNTGKGFKVPMYKFVRFYVKWVIPAVISVILVQGYFQKFAPELYNRFFG